MRKGAMADVEKEHFRAGDRVKVISGSYYRKTVNRYGTITQVYPAMLDIEFDVVVKKGLRRVKNTRLNKYSVKLMESEGKAKKGGVSKDEPSKFPEFMKDGKPREPYKNTDHREYSYVKKEGGTDRKEKGALSYGLQLKVMQVAELAAEENIKEDILVEEMRKWLLRFEIETAEKKEAQHLNDWDVESYPSVNS